MFGTETSGSRVGGKNPYSKSQRCCLCNTGDSLCGLAYMIILAENPDGVAMIQCVPGIAPSSSIVTIGAAAACYAMRPPSAIVAARWKLEGYV